VLGRVSCHRWQAPQGPTSHRSNEGDKGQGWCADLRRCVERDVTVNWYAKCAANKEVKGTNSMGSAKQEDESSPSAWHHQTAPMEAIRTVRWTVLLHPHWSPDVAPPDFRTCGLLKDAFWDTPFCRRWPAKHSMREELRRFSKEFYATGVGRLTQSWKNCVL
jgi:hypothetical protein